MGLFDSGDPTWFGGGESLLPDLDALLASLGSETGNLVMDTITGEIVDASTVDPADIMDAMGLFGTSSDFPDAGPVGTYDFDAAAAGETGAGYGTPAEVAATAPFNASAGGGSDWWKAAAQGVKALADMGLGKGLAGLSGSPSSGGGGGASYNGGGMMTAPQMGGIDLPSLPSVQAPPMLSAPGLTAAPQSGGLDLPDSPNFAALPSVQAPTPLRAEVDALGRLNADPGTRIPMQEGLPISPVAPFQPLNLPLPGGGAPMGPPGPVAPILTGLQALIAQRRG